MQELFRLTITGGESLIDDLKELTGQINRKVPSALRAVGAEMTKSLQKHIQDDVYAKYQPKMYERRSSGSLADSNAMHTDVHSEKDEHILFFQYTPSGEQTQLRAYQETHPGSNVILHGDALIKRIQTGRGYTFTRSIPSRPFWNNFLEEQQNGGIMTAFAQGMEPVFTVERDNDYVMLSFEEAPDAPLSLFQTEGELPF